MQGEGKAVRYILQHGVHHPKKPHKIRLVFDWSAQFKGESLNKHLFQGPDFTNTLVVCVYKRKWPNVLKHLHHFFLKYFFP